MSEPYGVVPASEPNRIVVAMLHERLVLAALERLQLVGTVVERSSDLELTLLSLPADAVQAFADTRDRNAPYPIDVVMGALHDEFGDYGGWYPTMGKNLAIARVSHNIGGGDEGPPTPVNAAPKQRPRPGPSRPAAVVGIADTGLYPHPDLDGAYVAPSASLLLDVGPSTDYAAGHATFIAGAALREAPDARLEVYQVLDADGMKDSWEVAKRLVQLGRSGVDVLNMSFGCFTEDDKPPLVLATAIDRLDADIVLVAAAGNHANAPGREGRRPLWPAALDDVVAVGATDADGCRPEWSQAPAKAPWIDVLARGVDIVSTYLPGRLAVPASAVSQQGEEVGPFEPPYASWSGTSFAAARVSGAIASRIVPGRRSGKDALEEMLGKLPDRDGLPWLG